jgi:glycosyltransferase involved in cell wall biosynthesis
MPTLPVTLLVITHNEAEHIARCLNSVAFAAEKIVVDSGSTDDTVKIAEQCGARVVQQTWLGFGAQRNFATTQATHEWILFLDADEALTPELAQELEQALPRLMRSDAAAGILLRTAWFMGKPLRWYRLHVREKKARLYHRERARWADVRVHESLQYQGHAVTFRAPFMHYLNPTLAHAELKYLRYSELKARDWLDRKRATRPWEWPFVFITTFLKDYVLRLAMLDGWRGWVAAYSAANYAIYKRIRYYEMCTFPESRQLAEDILKQHDLMR